MKLPDSSTTERSSSALSRDDSWPGFGLQAQQPSEQG
jgi:hypothetical protein